MAENLSLKELAVKLNVSTSTISRVMNDKPGVGEKTRQRVLEAIQKSNYVSNSSARSLKTSRTRNIALISKKREARLTSADYFHRSVTYIEKELRNRGYHTIALALDDEEMESSSDLLMLREKRVDGFVVRGPAVTPKFILDLKNTGLAVVLFGNELKQTEIDCVVCKNRIGTYKITRHLIEKHGHKKILFLAGPEGWYTNDERKLGYSDALREEGLQDRIIHMPDTTIDTGKNILKEVVENIYPDITAVVAVNDATAIGVMDEARYLGMKVPEDIAVVGFDDIAWATLSYPPLTTVHMFLEEMGKITVSRLLDLLEEPRLHPTKSIVTTSLVIRKSCGC
ncbi:MAG: LacI family DNA-binding transcriptional regulator [Spirochaetaceae bacterium]|nr:LacI family DNA-binding transcriptional regulator [Spirochaetaceae bacterium]